MDKHLIMGTAGHVDHGKTALIAALTGIDCDTHKEEKTRGITINLGFAHLELNNDISIGIIDVPGHKDFIRTMVAGAYGIDFVLLVVAADSGIMPQTKEHLNILQMLGVKQGLVALTKIDIVDEEMQELAEMEIIDYLEKTSLNDAPIVPVSSKTGEGIEKLKHEIGVIASQVSVKKTGNLFRMYTDRVFNVKGHGLVVTGSVLNGKITVGSTLYTYPGRGEKLKVRGIERHGNPVEHAVAGDRAAFNLSGMKQADFERGMLLLGQEMEPSEMIDAYLELFEGKVNLEVWSHVIFHTGTFYCNARMHLLNKDLLKGGENAIVQVHLEKPSILLKKDKFIIRNTSDDITLGGGTIIDEKPLHHKRRTNKLEKNLGQVVEAMLDEENLRGLIMIEAAKFEKLIPLKTLSEKIDVDAEEIKSMIEDKQLSGLDIINLNGNDYLISDSYRQQLTENILTILSAWHKGNPLFAEGLEIKELSGKTGLVSAPELQFLQTHLTQMSTEDKLKKVGTTWAISGHKVKIDPRTKGQLEWLEHKIKGFGMQKPTLKELEPMANREKINKGKLIMLLNFLSNEGKIYFNGGEFMHTSFLDLMRNKLLKALSTRPRGMNEKEFRLLIDGTKKMVQVLINIFVQEGVIEKQTYYLMITKKGMESV
ncbi:MAG: selenocysteine-specific translation elongation factor [Bacteroidetes bacterium 4572_114]|nr:MAG: selenocysteine-specific translation elongation factor [Bacteroidetes bacterium 4572_114]